MHSVYWHRDACWTAEGERRYLVPRAVEGAQKRIPSPSVPAAAYLPCDVGQCYSACRWTVMQGYEIECCSQQEKGLTCWQPLARQRPPLARARGVVLAAPLYLQPLLHCSAPVGGEPVRDQAGVATSAGVHRYLQDPQDSYNTTARLSVCNVNPGQCCVHLSRQNLL
jgi:hypothetical protein